MDRRTIVLVLGVATLATVLGAPQAGAQGGDLVADAGDSRASLGVDTTFPVEARAFGGEEPYNFTWSLNGSTDAFEDPNASETVVDVGNRTGTIEVNVTVEDNASATARDTVVYHVAERVDRLVDANFTLGPGVPDEFLGASGLDGGNHSVNFSVPAGTGGLLAELTWQNGSQGFVVRENDLDLVLRGPDGEERSPSQGRSPGHPEHVTVRSPDAGNWTAEIEAWLTTEEDARLRVLALDTVQVPSAVTPGPKLFGSEDLQELEGRVDGDDPDASWDLDNDGLFETPGEDVVANLAPGNHPVRLRAEDDLGLRATSGALIQVTDDVEHALPLHCGGRPSWPFRALEFSASGGTCWLHGGHHTYHFNGTFEVEGVQGRVFSVEQQFSPPTSVDANGSTPMRFETSADAQNWTQVGPAEYEFVENVTDGVIFDEIRQGIRFQLDADGQRARFLRIHQPRSSAEGLSGFLDASRLYALANEVPDRATTESRPGEVELSCEDGDVLEDFFEDHPCTFGGVNRWDAASFFHTYHPGEGTLVDRAEVTVEVAPWRSDDFFTPIPVTTDRQRLGNYSDQVTGTTVSLQVSEAGQEWTTLAAAEADYGDQQRLTVDFRRPVPAPFVRVIPGVHPLFDQPGESPSLHHPDAFFLSSEIVLEGQVPVS